MIETIEALCANTHNYFIESMHHGDFTIENGNISLPFLVEGQFFAIIGSKFNDGVYIYLDSYIIKDATWDDVLKDNPNWGAITDDEWGTLGHHELIDETFHGSIWAMRMPRAFLQLAKEIEEYNASDAAKPTGYTSESISGHYSYTKASPQDTAWQKVFASKLNRWRKVAARWG